MKYSKLLQYIVRDIGLLSCELDNFTFKLLYWVILFWYYTQVKKTYNSFAVPCEKPKIVSFAFSIIKNIVVFPSWYRFPVKLT